MIEIVNRQRKIKTDFENLRQFTVQAVEKIPEIALKSLAVAFISDKKILELNLFYCNKYTSTYVLSFPSEPDEFDADTNYLGDIVISLEQAAKQAGENNLDFETEIKQLILHGILHLCGYDHETDAGEMNARELKLRDKLSIN